MRKPGALLALVYTEFLEPLEQALRELPAFPRPVLEDDHADAPRLAVAQGGEDNLTGRSSRLSKSSGDGIELRGRPGAEEGERDVEMLARDFAPTAELLGLPPLEAIDNGVREPEGAEETQAVMAPDGTGRAHA